MSGVLAPSVMQHLLRPLQHVGVLGALRAAQNLPALLHSAGASRSFGTDNGHSSVYITDVDGRVVNQTPLLLGLVNYFERHLPYVGYFAPVGGTAKVDSNHPVDQHLRLMHDTFELKHDIRQMVGVAEEEATRLIAAGKTADLLDRIYSSYAAYKDMHDVVVVQGLAIGTEEVDALVASALGAPAIITSSARASGPSFSIADHLTSLMFKRQSLADHKVPVLGAVVNKVPRADHAIISNQLDRRCQDASFPLLGCIPDDPLLRSVRLDEVQSALNAEFLFASKLQLDQEFDVVQVATHKVEELLEILATDGTARPLILTSVDRLDLLLGLLASQVSVAGPSVAGIVLTPAGNTRSTRTFARATAQRIFDGIRANTLFKGSLLPVMTCDRPMVEVVRAIDQLHGIILPSSTKKIGQCKALFDKFVNSNLLVERLQEQEAYTAASGVMTPKMFMHEIKSKCQADPQRIVLPESNDPRVLTAAAEVAQRGLARVTLLGDPDVVNAEVKKLGLDISLCSIVNPLDTNIDRYVEALVETRKKKGMTKDVATDAIRNDPNVFGVMMVALGDAGGMVSGACHTTAATIRPAMQVLKTKNLVSSCFFMCLPDKVLVYADCAVNVSPSSEELAQIATVSADTAAAFGIEPRVAMLSYSTMGSGAGPDVQKVTDAVAMAKAGRPDVKLEGPIQYDAAIDPAVAAVKIKGDNQVAGKATVFVFPDLNTGNNTYKAVQQASGAIAIGPIMQGLSKPVNDLSRGCTVADIINTIGVTSVQAMQAGAGPKATMAATAAMAAATA